MCSHFMGNTFVFLHIELFQTDILSSRGNFVEATGLKIEVLE